MILLVFFIFYFFICKIPVGDLLVFLHSNSSPHMGRKAEKSWGKTKNNQRNKLTKKSQKKKKKSKPLHNWEKIKQRDALVCVISSFWNENLAFCAITPKVSPRFASLLVEKEIRLVCCSPLPDPAWSVSRKCIWKWCPKHFCLWLKTWKEKRQGGESLIQSLFFQFIHV